MKKRTQKSKSCSIFHRIFRPIFLLILFQAAMFFFATMYGGVINALDQNAEEILAERVVNRAQELETTFLTEWTNMKGTSKELQNLYKEYTKELGPWYKDTKRQKEYIKEAIPILIAMLRENKVNGVFLILNDEKEYQPLEDDETQQKYGFCIRDYDIHSSYKDKEDLMLLRCPTALVSELDCPMESRWEPFYSFTQGSETRYYYNPLKAAYENPGVDIDNLSYVCGLHSVDKNDKKVLSVSIPLVDETGYPFAVLGVELTEAYLETLLPSRELYGQNVGSYMLVQYKTNSSFYKKVAENGILYQQVFGNADVIYPEKSTKGKFFEVKGNDGVRVCGSVIDLRIYNKNTPFENEKLALVGLVRKNTLYKFSYHVKKILFFVTMMTLLVGIVSIFFVSSQFASPIKKLAQKVKSIAPNEEFHLDMLGIEEIDQLIVSIKDLSRQVSEDQARTEFFSRMSHDMRTPMNAILGFSSSEILEEANEQQKDEYLEKIHMSGEYLLGLINEVLDITKIEKGKAELHEEPTSMKEILADIFPIIDGVAKQKQVTFEEKIFDDGDSFIQADKRRLEQVLVNLLSNAVKFNKKDGKVIFTLETVRKEMEQVSYRISVKDNGIGIGEDFLEKIYVPFEQEREGNGGTGLGLSISKRLIEMMGGEIQCHTKVGVGTEFIVLLTCKMVQKPKEEKQKEVYNLQGRRVLLCEDNALNAKITTNLLTKKGMIVDWKENGKKGVQSFMDSPVWYYDVILTDIRMPEMDGLEATSQIRKMKREDAKQIPIIAMTANILPEDIENSQKVGISAHLSKPIEPQMVFATLSQLLSTSKKEE